VILFNVSLTQGLVNHYPITLSPTMKNQSLQAGVGLAGITSTIERIQGWTLTVYQLTTTTLTV
jgi:hypothetical protein